ncbi:MAG: TolC family protein, partial [Candidatus Omnitrophica bacterium]|nr:TolC family protein [Candidatus Omnitrophota bacterium]
MKASGFEQDQYREQKKRAEQLLFTDVADAFYLFLQYQEDIKVLESIWTALSDRVVELKKREDIGRSRQSEVVNTETQLYNIEAQIEAVKGQMIIANELLNFLTGKDVHEVVDNEEVPNIFQEKGFYNKKAGNRPDVRSAQYGWRAQKELIGVARSGFFPTISLEGDYSPRPKTDNTDWTTFLTINVPIFQGTTTYAEVKEAKSKARAQELEFQRKTRLAFQDINDSFTWAQSAFMQFRAYEKALKSAEINFALQKEDYTRSFVSNLDV